MRIGEVTEIHATTEVDAIDDLLTDEAQMNVYRIVQECANNIIKHSQAAEALLTVKRHEHEITLLAQDNGRGFVRESAPVAGASTALTGTGEPPSERGGFGLIGIAERVKMLRGNLEIESEHGTRIRIRIPTE
jgi:signal transduction histidine kinase